MRYTTGEIAEGLGAALFGAPNLTISGVAEPADAGPDDLAIAMKPEFAARLSDGKARAAILWDGADWLAFGLDCAIMVPRPRYALSGLTRLMDPGPDIASGIHAAAVVDPSAVIGEDVSIGPFTVIGAGVRIGAGCRISSHVVIARGSEVGEGALIHCGVRIMERVRIGKRLICHPNAVVGSDGFSFVTPEKSSAERARETLGVAVEQGDQSWTRIHSLGGVEIGDDVEIGAGSTIDAGTIRATRVGRGTKLDNLVHLGHNVVVGENTLLCGQVGVAGSARVGNRVVLGGQCGVSDNIFVGDDVVAGGATKMFTNVPAGRVVLGSPAIKMDQHIELTKGLRRLPRLFRDVADIKKAVQKPDGSD
ncbi:UDP-3-O-(3-hydroxymyristoyl)glucosamine N-acyltransferase [Ovoidimarina sediminis]|uniref:UDP-3-O-(3-hydroxymyristoyl)glucosamine N-acyltransferase n=1 Tax=Ovoidimarina sediminis TaxID=3079856 RepID=UPI00290C0373|nr:UDP-3-O-(3-hydroxymyristoyl)glucosamine N-acyltransferase [Rhodophyticola sp. MJ-SS7]MDU8942157.1 UDP-3-O-(3-hydroxymyristoyl)glucosamine N-acyltransferase [Rhodophyticola sp. MJ-SS7]